MKNEKLNTNEAFLKIIFDCLVRNGVENTTMRMICDATDLTASSLYYRFKNKDEIILEASYFGLNSVTRELFWVVAEKINNFQKLFIAFLKNVDARKQSIKLIYQVLASPKYGDDFKKMAHSAPLVIYKYALMLSNRLRCLSEEIMPYVGLTIAVIREYVIWGNRESTKQKLKFIYDKCLADCCKKQLSRKK
ncbi:MAG: helix-turn-helix transcriptional regulator [Clostridia bacterium]|nr:helix-turn-helix transcriptional regulator [Clostridia bacterium]